MHGYVAGKVSVHNLENMCAVNLPPVEVQVSTAVAHNTEPANTAVAQCTACLDAETAHKG